MFKSTYHCKIDGTKWVVKTRRCPTDDDPMPKCPTCSGNVVPIGIDLTLNKAPGIVGQNIAVKAVDETAKIVMEDHGLTDLKSSIREGDTMQPRLPPLLQAQADGFFGAKRRNTGMNVMAYGPNGREIVNIPATPPNMNPAFMKRAALAGSYRAGTPDAPGLLNENIRPRTNVVAST